MSVKTFRIHGKFKRNRKTQEFVKEVNGMKKEDVIELLLSTLGSQYHVKRYRISIENVEEIEK
ncbi:MAG: 50S ribosomal protein L18a [Candidatus Helarchaeota archaeon]|nr:50S ribosomal protein L18a [Candidatus Helarchaeota archaeon]